VSTLHAHLGDCMYTGDEHAAHMHAYMTVCTWEGGSGSTYICVHAYRTVCTREHLHTHARVRDCVSATVAHVSLCACSVRVLCDVTASNTRDSFTDGDGESCALHSTHGTLHAVPTHCTLRHIACMLEIVSEHAARTLG
jgi:hypothetical protein